MLSVDYIGFIPIIIESYNTQQSIIDQQTQRINQLEKTVTTCCSKSNGTPKLKSGTISAESSTTILQEATTSNTLAQNFPNPWNASTEIGVTLDYSIKTATICIYDLTGKQIRCYQVTARGETSVTIHAEELQPGMYLYSLLADGKLVDTKKMVLTE